MTVKIIFLVAAMLCGAVPAFAGKGTFFDRDQILHEYFAGADQVEPQLIPMTPTLAARLQRRLGYVPRCDSMTVWVGRKGGEVLGYAVIDDEKGMHEPITFAVLVDPNGSVVRQEVMAYREAEGDGVTRSRFRRQFVGKTVKDPIRAGVDITIVSGATISSYSMAAGVKRAVAIVQDGILDVKPAAGQEHERADAPRGTGLPLAGVRGTLESAARVPPGSGT